MHTFLAFRWTTSKAVESYGWNILTATDVLTGQKYRCTGGGYDMGGTVLAKYLEDIHQDKLRGITSSAYHRWHGEGLTVNTSGLYGLRSSKDGSMHLDGGCGIESMVVIARAIGLEVTRTFDRRTGHTTGFLIGPVS